MYLGLHRSYQACLHALAFSSMHFSDFLVSPCTQVCLCSALTQPVKSLTKTGRRLTYFSSSFTSPVLSACAPSCSTPPNAQAPQMTADMLQGEVLYRFARCRQPLSMRLMWNQGLPLPESQLEVVEPALKWEQLRVSLPSDLPSFPLSPAFQIT